MNNVCLVGRITKDIELRKTQNGLSVASFTVACNRPTKDRQADFINCVAWRHIAEYIATFGCKGSLVSVQGSIQTRNYEDADGKTVYVTEVLANQVSMLSKKEENHIENKSDHDNPNKSYKLAELGVDLTSEDLPF